MNHGKSKGITVFEVLLVVIILFVLLAILFPLTLPNRDRGQAKLTRCLAQLGSIGKAIICYTDDNNGYYPIGPSYSYVGTKTRLDRAWAPEYIGAYNNGSAKYAPRVQDRPLYKYTAGNPAIWRCPKEEKQDNGPNMPFDKPSSVWGTTYIFNGVYAWDGSWPKSKHNPRAFYTLMGKGWANRPVAARKCTEVLHYSKLWMVGERPMYHYWCLKRSQSPPVGHLGDKAFSPVVFCDGHAGVIRIDKDELVDPNGRWGFIEKGWHPDPKYAKYGL